MHVSLHELSYYVYIIVSRGLWWLLYVKQRHYVFVIKELYTQLIDKEDYYLES